MDINELLRKANAQGGFGPSHKSGVPAYIKNIWRTHTPHLGEEDLAMKMRRK